MRVTDGWTDGQNYDSQDCASIAASRGNNNHSGTVSVHFTRASVFMIYNGSEFAVFRLLKSHNNIDTTNQNAYFKPSKLTG